MAENQIAALSLGGFYTLRPGYIYPVEARNEPNVFYRITRMFYPLIKLFGKKYSIKSTDLAKAMVAVGLLGAGQEILENVDLLRYISQNDV